MTPSLVTGSTTHAAPRAYLVYLGTFLLAACGMRSALDVTPNETDPMGAGGDSTQTTVPKGAGGTAGTSSTTGQGGTRTRSSTGTATGLAGSTGVARGGAGGQGSGGISVTGSGGAGGKGGAGGMGGVGGSGGAATTFRDAGIRDALPDATPPGAPVIDPGSGYTTVQAGTVVLQGYVSSYVGGSGSSISLSYDATKFCAKGVVAANATYNSWAGAGFGVNQAQSGSSGSTGELALVGSSITVSYVNNGGSRLELQLWDGSHYWCAYLPASKTPNTTTIPFSKLNTRCWDGTGDTFVSGTSITTVQLVVPGSATQDTSFDYCFLGLTVQ